MPEKKVNGGFVACLIIGVLALVCAVGIQFLNFATAGDDSRDPRQMAEVGNFTLVCAISGVGMILAGVGLQLGGLARTGAQPAVAPGQVAVPSYPQFPQQQYAQQQPQAHYPQHGAAVPQAQPQQAQQAQYGQQAQAQQAQAQQAQYGQQAQQGRPQDSGPQQQPPQGQQGQQQSDG